MKFKDFQILKFQNFRIHEYIRQACQVWSSVVLQGSRHKVKKSSRNPCRVKKCQQGQEVPTRSRSPTKVKKSRQGLEVPARSTSYSKVYKFQRVLEVSTGSTNSKFQQGLEVPARSRSSSKVYKLQQNLGQEAQTRSESSSKV